MQQKIAEYYLNIKYQTITYIHILAKKKKKRENNKQHK